MADGDVERVSSPRPFLRWAGSKRWLVPSLLGLVPDEFGTYYEPFLGAGSLFFALRPQKAVLSDSLADLMDVYRAVRDGPARVLNHLAPMRPDPDLYRVVRERNSSGRFRRAADFLYLNRTSWNALYRVNSEGKYNVPYGRPKTDRLVDDENLRACSKALRQPGVRLVASDFEIALAGVKSGDLVFLDPPYVTGHNNNGFVDYNEHLFRWADQERLAKIAGELRAAGAHVLVTNASHDAIIDLYDGFDVRKVDRSSTIAGDTGKRGRVVEALIWAYGLKPVG